MSSELLTSTDAQRTQTPQVEAPGTAPAAPSQSRRFPAVDGLRGLAVLSILLYHSNWSSRGIFGVDVFFAVSGFLITLILLRELHRTNRIRLGSFYARRIKRLLPGLLITLALVLALSWLISTSRELAANGERALSAILQIANWQQIASGDTYWDHTGPIQPLAHLWSLSITEQFYLIWPFILLATWWATRRSPLATAIVLGTLTLASAAVSPLLFDGTNAERLYLGTDSRAVGFLAGGTFAAIILLTENRQSGRHTVTARSGRRLGITAVSAALLLVIIAAAASASSYRDPWIYEYGLALVAVAASVFIATLCSPHNRLTKFFSFFVFQALGRVSYSIFLLHLPVYWMLQTIAPAITPLMLFGMGATLSWILAAFLHYGITEPIRLASWTPTRGIPVFILSLALVAGAAIGLPALREAQHTSLRVSATTEVPLGAAGGRPVVLTIGDSLGNDMAAALQEYGNGLFAVHDGAAGGCGLLRHTVRTEDGQQDDLARCDDWRSQHPQTIEDVQPDIVLLHTAWDALDFSIDGSWVGPGDPAYDAEYARTLADFAEIVTKAGPHAQIVVMGDRPTTGNVSDPARTEAFETLLQDFAAAHDNVHFADLGEFLCGDGGICATTDDNGLPLFQDDNVHYTRTGMEALAPWLTAELAQVLEARPEE